MKIPFPCLKQDSRIDLKGVSHVVIGREDAGLVLRSSIDGATQTLDASALLQAYRTGVLVLPPQRFAGLEKGVAERLRFLVNELPEAQQAAAMHRHKYVVVVDGLVSRGRFSQTDTNFERAARAVAFLAKERAPSGTTLRSWYRRWVRSGRNITALAPMNHRKGRKPVERAPAVMKIVLEQARLHHLKPEGCSMEGLHVIVEGEIREHNERHGTSHEVPSPSQLSYLISRNIDAEERYRLVNGNRAARRKFTSKRRRGSPERLLGIVEIDHVLLDVIATRERTGVPLETEEDAPELKRGIAGRVWATIAICQRSRVVVGWSLSLDPPSWVSVMKCLRHVMSPKDDVRIGDLTVANPAWGKPRIIHIDNGKEFHSISLKVVAAMLGIEIRHMGRRQPWERGRIERFFREVQRDVATIPGRTFSNSVARGDYDSEATARFTLAEIKARFEKWVVGIHHHREHRGLFWQTPAEVWDELSQLGIDYPPSVEEVNLLTRQVLVKPLRDVGIEHQGLFWHSKAFEDVFRRNGPGKTYVTLLDPENLGDLLLLEETEHGPVRHRGEVDCPELVEGVDLSMWKRIRRRGRERTPAGERLRKEILFVTKRELLEEARTDDLAGEKLTRPKQKFADRQAAAEAARRRQQRAADADPGPTAAELVKPIATKSPGSVAERASHYA